MELSKLAAKPQLVEVSIDAEHIVEKYGEPIIFWTYDRLPLETFMKLSDSKDTGSAEMIETVKPLMLNKKGDPILVDGVMLPTGVLAQAITKIVGLLGKL